jgi:hypothetical protein
VYVYFGSSADFDYPRQFFPPLPRIIDSLLYFISRRLHVSALLLGHHQANLTQFRETPVHSRTHDSTRTHENYAKSQKFERSRSDGGKLIFFAIHLILLAALGPGVHSASSRNEYQKQRNIVSGE